MVLLDCRDPNEVALGKIPGAIHISRGRLEQNIEAAVPRNANLVVYCANGNRSALAAVTLRDMGYEQVSSMSVGFNGWTAIGGDVE
jgi:rhodanese-related sulfurtransferase